MVTGGAKTMSEAKDRVTNMTEYQQLVFADKTTVENYGFSLGFAVKAFGARPGMPTAREAWENTEFKHTERDLPEVQVPVWFSSVYDAGMGNQDIGHCAIHIPGQGLLSAPSRPSDPLGQSYVGSIEEIEKRSGGSVKYLGWSEDIGGVRVVAPASQTA